jgi:serine/threonine protein kinase
VFLGSAFHVYGLGVWRLSVVLWWWWFCVLGNFVAMSGERSEGLTGLLNTSTKDVLTARYRVLRTISSGTFSEVKLAYHRGTGTKVVVKMMQKRASNSHIESEISILKTLRHPNIVQLLHVEKTAEQVYLILEYASRGSLDQYVKTCRSLGETEARNFFKLLMDWFIATSRAWHT